MAQTAEKIKCPQCGFEIDVNEIVYHQLEEKLKKEYNAELAKQTRAIEEREAALNAQREALEREQKSVKERVEASVSQQLAAREAELKQRLTAEAEALKQKITTEAEQAQAERIQGLEQELKQKSEQVKELNRSRSEIERLKREKDELQTTIEAESEKKLNEALKSERERLRKDFEDRNQLRLNEREAVIEQLRKQLSEAQRKAEQGSSQSWGEVQELAIESWLREAYPLDTVEEVKKGAQGADCLQTVNTRRRTNCGTIYYESKRTRAFQPAWVEKFKNDIRDKNADIGVLVTEAMPGDMDHMGMRDGIWICSFSEFKGLSAVLRQTLIQLSSAVASQENKGSKMEMLYSYLTGTEFKLQVEAIVEGFAQMQQDLESEKRAIQAQWKKREKQIEKVLLNTTHMYSSIKGIAGNAVQAVKMLELPGSEEDQQ